MGVGYIMMLGVQQVWSSGGRAAPPSARAQTGRPITPKQLNGHNGFWRSLYHFGCCAPPTCAKGKSAACAYSIVLTQYSVSPKRRIRHDRSSLAGPAPRRASECAAKGYGGRKPQRPICACKASYTSSGRNDPNSLIIDFNCGLEGAARAAAL